MCATRFSECIKGLLNLCLLGLASFACASEVVLINAPLSENDKRYDYPKKLLSEILLITQPEYGSAVVEHTKVVMKRDRTLRELEVGVSIHVMAEAPKPGWEERLLPVRIPIRKGIQGYRTFLILKQNQPMLSAIRTLDELKKLPTGSGEQWSTTRVLRSNGFDVVVGNDYEGLFGMLVKGRFITFGRGINETPVEYETHKVMYPELAIEKDLLLYIPLPTYFFVTPTRPALAKRIEEGLTRMIADGSFDKLFAEEFGELINNANLKNRRVFRINNPNLSAATPLDKSEYWFVP